MLRKLLLALALVCVGSLHASAQEKASYTYCPRGEQYLYLYDSLSTFGVLANLKCGVRVEIIGRENTYLMVQTADGKQGYIPQDAITSAPPAKASTPRASTSSRLPQPTPAETPGPAVKTAAPAESNSSRLPQPAPAEIPIPPMKAPTPRESSSRSQERAPAEISAPAVKTPAPPELTTSRLPEPTGAETPTPPVKAPAPPESTTSRLPEPAPAETPTPTAPPSPTPITRAPQRTPPEISMPLAEFFGGYSYLNFDTNRLSSRQSFNGWESSFAINVNRWLAAEGGISGYYKSYSSDLTTLGLGRLKTNVHDHTFMAGPRIKFQSAFFHVLFGIEHLTATGMGYSASENSAAVAFGGGTQWRINRQWAVRASADYLLTRHNLLNAQSPISQNDIRISGGIVYTLRKRTE